MQCCATHPALLPGSTLGMAGTAANGEGGWRLSLRRGITPIEPTAVNIFAASQRLEIQARRASEWVRGGLASEIQTTRLRVVLVKYRPSAPRKMCTAVGLTPNAIYFGTMGGVFS